MKYSTILIRYGETFLKKGKRPFFISVLKRNILNGLNLPEFTVKEVYGFLALQRKDLELFEFNQSIQGVMQRTFGIQSYSPAVRLPLDISSIEQAFVAAIPDVLRNARSFRVSASRSFKGFPIKSMELNRRLGALIVEKTGLSVNLEHPDVDLGLLIHQKGAFFFPKTYDGPGGLPVGASGKGILLLSGGIDSPVAGFMVMKRGVHIVPVSFQCGASGIPGREKVRDLANILASYQGRTMLFMFDADPWKQGFGPVIPARYRLVILRRFMLRAAQRVAQMFTPAPLITGDAIGQVASQTIENLITIQASVNTLVVRPLAGFDKVEVMDRARKYGSYETSILPVEDCCGSFAPKHPETRATPEAAEKIESKLDIQDLVNRVLGTLQVSVLPENSAKANKLFTIYYRLRLLYGHRNWWPGDTPFEIILGAILTQNTAWSNVERAITNLKERSLMTPEAILNADDAVLEAAIRPAGYFRVKAKRLRSVVSALVQKGGSNLQGFRSWKTEGFRDFLLKINGIGPETADSILLYAFNRPVFVVDAYTKRLLTRMGFAEGQGTYQQVQDMFHELLPVDTALYNDFHAQIVNLGKDYCRTKPRCDACPLQDICPKM